MIARLGLAFGLLMPVCGMGQAARTLRVGAGAPFQRIADALSAAPEGARIVIGAGTYREPTLVVRRRVALVGDSGAVLDGEGRRTVLLVEGDDVLVEGLTIVNTGASQLEERAAVRVRNARRCTVRRNRIDRAAFGVALERTTGCVVTGNTVRGTGGGQMETGNGIHAWNSDSLAVEGNTITGHRDGIYFEFVTAGRVHTNISEHNARYGMHFMFSHQCEYERNTYRANGNGVAVMYSKGVAMRRNTFADNVGTAAYGLLLKDIDDSAVEANQFIGNTIGLYLEDSGRNHVDGNDFRSNGWGLKVLASSQGNRFTANAFEGNAFDVGTNSRTNYSTFVGNYWDRYAGYDLDRNGRGDVPFAPVRLFALIVEQSPASLVLLRSTLVDLLDLAERAFPALSPDVRDEAPLVAMPRGRSR